MSEWPDWAKSLPWGKIAAGIATAVLAAAGGTLHLEGDAAREAGQKVQGEHLLRHWGETCQVVADSLDQSVQVRFCSSDSCYHFRLARPGAVLSFFAVAGVPVIPGSLGSLIDLPGGPLYAQSAGCIDPREHGSPDHPEYPIEYGPTDGAGWQVIWWNWHDGCRLELRFHRPSGAWSDSPRWVRCAGSH